MLGKLKQYLLRHTKQGRSRYLKFLYRYDQTRYFAHSAMEQQDAQTVAAQIRLLVHALEKGLSVQTPKADFGKEKVCRLLELMEQYKQAEQNPDPQALELAAAVIGTYAQHRLDKAEDVSFIPEELRKESPLAGAQIYVRKPVGDFAETANNRHSLRTFGEGAICVDTLVKAVHLAQTAPSACNRQATHVFACLDAEKNRKIMERHGGTRGFTQPAAILAITGNLRLYQNEYERNTVFVDGGIFLMNLLYALDYHDLAACPIIWGAEPDNDRFLSDLLGIPEYHAIVSLVIVGNYPQKTVKIPCSSKRDTTTILHMIDRQK